jgi:hypothetical protein
VKKHPVRRCGAWTSSTSDAVGEFRSAETEVALARPPRMTAFGSSSTHTRRAHSHTSHGDVLPPSDLTKPRLLLASFHPHDDALDVVSIQWEFDTVRLPIYDATSFSQN